MDTKWILKQYGPLLEKLTEEQKSFLEGMDAAIEDLENFKYDFEFESEETRTLERIQNEIALDVLDTFKTRLEGWKEEYTIAFIEGNPYRLDENGNVVKESA